MTWGLFNKDAPGAHWVRTGAESRKLLIFDQFTQIAKRNTWKNPVS